jgi:hypothetical protein
MLAGMYFFKSNTAERKNLSEQLGNKPKISIYEVHLLPKENLQPRDPVAFSAAIQEFRDLGFQDAGTFEIEGRSSALLHAFVLPRYSLYGIVNENRNGLYSEICAILDGRGNWGADNISYEPFLEPVPGYTQVRRPGATVRELLDEWTRIKHAHRVKPVTDDGFQRSYEQETRHQIEDRIIAEMTPESIRKMMAKLRRTRSDEQIAKILHGLKTEHSNRLEWVAKEQFRLACGKSDEEWKLIESRLRVIHEKMTVERAIALVPGYHVRPPVSMQDPIEVFEYANQQIPEQFRLDEIGQVEIPLKAKVFLIPLTAYSA